VAVPGHDRCAPSSACVAGRYRGGGCAQFVWQFFRDAGSADLTSCANRPTRKGPSACVLGCSQNPLELRRFQLSSLMVGHGVRGGELEPSPAVEKTGCFCGRRTLQELRRLGSGHNAAQRTRAPSAHGYAAARALVVVRDRDGFTTIHRQRPPIAPIRAMVRVAPRTPTSRWRSRPCATRGG
jgi:hypothetical protein